MTLQCNVICSPCRHWIKRCLSRILESIRDHVLRWSNMSTFGSLFNQATILDELNTLYERVDTCAAACQVLSIHWFHCCPDCLRVCARLELLTNWRKSKTALPSPHNATWMIFDRWWKSCYRLFHGICIIEVPTWLILGMIKTLTYAYRMSLALIMF